MSDIVLGSDAIQIAGRTVAGSSLGRVMCYQVTDSTDVALSQAPTQANIGSTFSAVIPTKGFIMLDPYFRLTAVSAAGYAVWGVRIGSTNYWPKINWNGSDAYRRLGSANSGITAIMYANGAGGDATDYDAIPLRLSIEKLAIPTGAQTIQIVAAKKDAAGTITIQGSTGAFSTLVNVAIFDHT